MVISEEANRFLHDKNGSMDQLEIHRCPRCKQFVFCSPDEILTVGDVCDDCYSEWWDELYEGDQI